MSDTYSAVDRSTDPESAADWQDRIDGWPSVVAYKRYTHALCAGARSVLDVGCGPGNDLRILAADRGGAGGGGAAVGVDSSLVMTRRSAARGATVAVADGHTLPFRAGSFDAVRADRTIQHLAEPERALGELVRVLAPGGVLVVADPDQGSLVIEVPGAPADLVATMRARRRDHQYRNGTFVRRLPKLLREHGLERVEVEAHTLVLTDPDDAFGIATWGEEAAAAGAITCQQATVWADAVAAAAGDGFLYTVTFFVVSGRLPGNPAQ